MRRQGDFRRGGAILWLLMALIVSAAPAGDQSIDWQRARELRRREQRGDTLTADEQAYLERAMAERSRQARENARPTGKESTGLVPVPEMGETLYKGQTGGLYGGGQNMPPEPHARAAGDQAALIQPLDPNGVPSEAGIIVLISVGMSNTTQEFSAFKKLADADPNKSADVMLVDCAQGGMAAHQWAYPEKVLAQNRPSPWVVMDQRLRKAGVTAEQVQVVWLKQAQMVPSRLGEFPGHAESLRDDIAVTLRELKVRFPNLRLAYLSSRIYAGYASTALNPEPYAYESAFSVRWLIDAQIEGDPELNCDPTRGEVKVPLLLWGPYLWADGIVPRQSDGLVWNREDLAQDGTHPSTSGRQKVAELLLGFFKTDANTKRWFLREPGE